MSLLGSQELIRWWMLTLMWQKSHHNDKVKKVAGPNPLDLYRANFRNRTTGHTFANQEFDFSAGFRPLLWATFSSAKCALAVIGFLIHGEVLPSGWHWPLCSFTVSVSTSTSHSTALSILSLSLSMIRLQILTDILFFYTGVYYLVYISPIL